MALEFRSSLGEEDKKPSAYYQPEYFEVEKMHPAPGTDIPDHLPEEVARLFQQAADNVPANPDAAGIMFRKTLEAILRDKCLTGGAAWSSASNRLLKPAF